MLDTNNNYCLLVYFVLFQINIMFVASGVSACPFQLNKNVCKGFWSIVLANCVQV